MYFIGKLDMFPLMCAAGRVWITELTLIQKILGQFVTRMVMNSLRLILKIIDQCDIKHILTSPIKTTPENNWLVFDVYV